MVHLYSLNIDIAVVVIIKGIYILRKTYSETIINYNFIFKEKIYITI